MEEIHRRIPHRPPFLFVDEIVEITDLGATTRLNVRPDSPFFEGHYPGNPIMPGVLLCEAVFQTGAIYLAEKLGAEALDASKVDPVLSRIRDARFKRMILPGDVVEIFGLTSEAGKVKNGQLGMLTEWIAKTETKYQAWERKQNPRAWKCKTGT